MTPKAISFTPEVLKAKLRALEAYGRCQTRRPVRREWLEWMGEPDGWEAVGDGTFRAFDHMENETRHFPGPFGAVGQRLWTRERARVIAANAAEGEVRLRYELDGAERVAEWPDRIVGVVVGHCLPNGVFREGARHLLEVVEVRAERVAEISGDDCVLEGINPSEVPGVGSDESLRQAYFVLYDSIYGAGAHARDWCWVYTLKRTEP
jgi:hypothetical protein